TITPTPIPTPIVPSTTFNVKDYGATGGGIADDTVAIQKTVDAAAVIGGGIVYLPTGTYRTYVAHSVCPDVGGSIDLKDNIRLKGDGPGKTFVVGANSNTHPIAACGKTNIGVSDLEIYGVEGTTGIDGIKFYGCNSVTVSNIVAHDLYEGIALYGAHDSIIEDSVAYNNSNVGIDTGESALGVQQGANNIVRNCTTRNNANAGFRFSGYPPPQTTPIIVSRANGTTWDHCTSINDKKAFFPSYAQNLTVTNCIAITPLEHGLEIYGTDNVTITAFTGEIRVNHFADVVAKYGYSSNVTRDGIPVVAVF
ncbi:MAG: glycosyl hydrolase family 28-related protein, partial [Candidatus Saccharibacteria bacterium]